MTWYATAAPLESVKTLAESKREVMGETPALFGKTRFIQGLPTIPLLPVSGSQAVIGSVVGIGLLQGIRGIRQIRWNVLVGIASGWITTPLLAAVMGFVLLFVVQNVFGQQVYQAEVNPPMPTALQRPARAAQPITRALPFRGEIGAVGAAGRKGSGNTANLHGEKQADLGEA